MDLIQMTRELGKAIQASEEYRKMQEAQTACDGDAVLQDGIGEFNLLRMQISTEAPEEGKGADKLQGIKGQPQGG